MDPWGSIILIANFLLLVAGWILFQQAKSDLTARAAETPILSEIKALQKSVAAMLEQIKLESVQTSAQLEARCVEARDLLAALDRKLEETKPTPRASARRREAVTAVRESEDRQTQAEEPAHNNTSRYQEVYALADDGFAVEEIAQRAGLTQGEVELILSIRAAA
jgi:protein-tyrosine-phosphatase